MLDGIGQLSLLPPAFLLLPLWPFFTGQAAFSSTLPLRFTPFRLSFFFFFSSSSSQAVSVMLFSLFSEVEFLFSSACLFSPRAFLLFLFLLSPQMPQWMAGRERDFLLDPLDAFSRRFAATLSSPEPVRFSLLLPPASPSPSRQSPSGCGWRR